MTGFPRSRVGHSTAEPLRVHGIGILPLRYPDSVPSAMIPGTMNMSRMPTYWNRFPFETSKFTMVWKMLTTFACMDVCFHVIYVAFAYSA